MRRLTPHGPAGITVYETSLAEIQVGGGDLRGMRAAHPCDDPAPRLCTLWFDGVLVDEVLAVARGERLELHCHGSVGLQHEIARRFPVTEGEVRAEDILLRTSLSWEQFDLALEQRQYDVGAELTSLESMVGEARQAALHRWRERTRCAAAHMNAQRVVLFGCTNAGKSSLFNRLLMCRRSLAGATPGLTRDPVHGVTTLCGYPYEIVDTAGESRGLLAPLDLRSMQAGRERREGAIAMLVVDAERGVDAEVRAHFDCADLVVATRRPAKRGPWPSGLPCDAEVCSVGMESRELQAVIGAALRDFRQLPTAGPVGGPAALARADLERLRELS